MKKLTYFILVTSLLIASIANAKQDKSINFSSQHVEVKGDLTTYSKDVVITDQAIVIKADKAFMENASSSKAKVVASGNLATFEQSSIARQKVTGSGKVLEYSPKLGKIEIKGDATLTQNGKTIKSTEIKYNLKTSQYEAGSK